MSYPKFFRKVIKGNVGGRVLNNKGNPEEFLLKGDPANSDNFDDITVEIKDEEAEKYFRKHNKSTVTQGYLIEISEYAMILNEVNAVTDGFLKDLLKDPFLKMKKRVEEFTSPIPVHRLLEFAQQENKPIKTIEYINSAIAKLESTVTPQGIDTDGIKVQVTNV
jgi:hypothetical protein